jgi:hypothetical protein
MKTGTMILAAGAGLAALLIGDQMGLFGGVEGGSGGSKKGTVVTGVAGVTPSEWGNVPVETSQAQPDFFSQLAAVLQLTDLQIFPQASGETKYSGIRTAGSTKKEIEGTLRTDLFGQMSLDPVTLQLYQGTPNDKVVLYTEGSRDIAPVTTSKKSSSSSSSSSSSTGSAGTTVYHTAVGTTTTKKDTSGVHSQTGAPAYHW